MSALDEKLKTNLKVERFSLDLTPTMKADLHAFAKARGVTVAKLLRAMIELHIYADQQNEQI